MDIAFRVFQKKEIYEFLQGDGDQELVQYNGKWYGLPYHRASDLGSICRSFGEADGVFRQIYAVPRAVQCRDTQQARRARLQIHVNIHNSCQNQIRQLPSDKEFFPAHA